MAESEQRRFTRVPHIVEIRYRSDSPPMTGRMTDISEGGLFVDVSQPLSPGSQVTFEFVLPSVSKDPIVGEGKVMWQQKTVGMGIEFLTVKEEDRAKIQKFIWTRQ